jgi:uncharacterized protein YbjT (DUF2867 family)
MRHLMLLLLTVLLARSFSFQLSTGASFRQSPSCKLTAGADADHQEEIGCSRRDLFSLAPAAMLGCGTLMAGNNMAWAATPSSWGVTADRPIAILGANGRTGREVAQALAKEGLYAVTMTRTGKDPYQKAKLPEDVKAHLAHYPDPVNVVDSDGLQEALIKIKASAIIFCASASTSGGSAFEVDDEGVGNAALAAKKLNARLVVVSALAVDRPDSKGFKMTNTIGGNFNGIMDAKRNGEEKVRATLAGSKDYVIVRPGPLLSTKSQKGPSGIQINQGDTIGGGISRDELAGVVVGALVSGKRGATVEVYRTYSATPLQPNFSIPSGREATAETYKGLFDGVQSD